jgi:hypothetical protein
VAEKVSDRIHILQSEESSIAFPHTPPTQEDLFAAAKLLLDIAGPGQEHVEMSREGPAKYFTVHRPLRLDDMHRHLHGSRTKGATLQHPDGLTRAIVDDADTPQDWERLQEAAILLAAAGFKPILEPSPVQDGDHVGGGHLWIIFDAFVEAYAARRTLCYYAPMLAESREYWPNAGNRIRLPGGRYIRPGFEAWCSLYDAAGNELSHDGPGAAQMLLQYQSPVDLLLVVQKPTPQKALPPARKRPPAGEQQGLSLVKQVIADFNDSHSWEEIAGLCGGFDRSKKFAAIWRGDRTPNVSVDPKTDRAKDFSSNAWLPRTMDQYQVWCLIQGGLGWEEFRRRDLAQRCRELERQAEPPKQEPQERGALILSAEQGQEPKSIAAQVNNSEIVALAEELGAMICDACTRCGCPLHWDRQGEPFCCRCYPKPRAGWSDDARRRLRALPRKVVI